MGSAHTSSYRSSRVTVESTCSRSGGECSPSPGFMIMVQQQVSAPRYDLSDNGPPFFQLKSNPTPPRASVGSRRNAARYSHTSRSVGPPPSVESLDRNAFFCLPPAKSGPRPEKGCLPGARYVGVRMYCLLPGQVCRSDNQYPEPSPKDRKNPSPGCWPCQVQLVPGISRRSRSLTDRH